MICTDTMYINFSFFSIVDMFHLKKCGNSEVKKYQAFLGAIGIIISKEGTRTHNYRHNYDLY